MSPLMLSFAMFNKFALSTAVGSFVAESTRQAGHYSQDMAEKA
jgi:hypothetical protein